MDEVRTSSKRANIRKLYMPPMFALFEDASFGHGGTAGSVRFALFTSGYGYSPPSATLP